MVRWIIPLFIFCTVTRDIANPKQVGGGGHMVILLRKMSMPSILCILGSCYKLKKECFKIVIVEKFGELKQCYVVPPCISNWF